METLEYFVAYVDNLKTENASTRNKVMQKPYRIEENYAVGE